MAPSPSKRPAGDQQPPGEQQREPRRARTEERPECERDAAACVKAMEMAIVFSPDDLRAYLDARGQAQPTGLAAGYTCSGSHAGRNIEAIYGAAEAAGVSASLEDAVVACFRQRRVRHVLLCSGFYVLHGGGPEPPAGVARGSCETDGPLGVLALVRAFASRGVYTSLLCEVHTGPVIRAGYEAMVQHFASSDKRMAEALRRYSRCLPTVSDAAPSDETPSQVQEFAGLHGQAFPGEPLDPACVRTRALRLASQLASSLREAWSGSEPGSIDCLFALERLGMPYRNIRGKHIGSHTEPVDLLWPLVKLPAPGAEQPSADEDPAARCQGVCQQSAESIRAFLAEHKLGPEVTAALRRVAGVTEDALTLGIGDGGNEVGMGKVAHLEGVAPLKPKGDDFVQLSVNGCYCTCDHVLLSTVSNWGGTAFELASQVFFPAEADYIGTMRRGGTSVSSLERLLLEAIVDAHSVDGITAERKHQVDGMPYEPHHRELYEMLWRLADGGAHKTA